MTACMNSVAGGVRATDSNILWTIDKFCGTCAYPGDYLESPFFPISYNNKFAKFSLELYPRGKTHADGKNVSIYVCNQSKFKVTLWCEVSFLNSENINVCKEVVSDCETFEPYASWGFQDFVELSFIMDTRNGILNNEKLIISCLLKESSPPVLMDKKRKYEYVFENNKLKEEACLARIATHDHFEKMFETGVFSDVTVSTAERKEFHLHKCVLASRSAVFQAMLNSDMKESKLNFIVIPDFSFKILKELFRFMYTGKVEEIKEVSYSLMRAAHKYCIQDLATMCEETLCQNLTLDNVLQCLVTADLFSAKNLKADAINYIVSHGNIIVNKPEFKTLVNKETACEIISAIFSSNKK